MEYEAKVQSFMAIGLIVKHHGNSFIIHRKHLFKEKKNFKKGELLIAKFEGYDQMVIQFGQQKHRQKRVRTIVIQLIKKENNFSENHLIHTMLAIPIDLLMS